jgi:hypothetical protein
MFPSLVLVYDKVAKGARERSGQTESVGSSSSTAPRYYTDDSTADGLAVGHDETCKFEFKES